MALDLGGLLSAAIVPLLYFGACGLGVWFLWHIRDRQPGNTRYSVAIYCGIGGCILLMLIGFKAFRIL